MACTSACSLHSRRRAPCRLLLRWKMLTCSAFRSTEPERRHESYSARSLSHGETDFLERVRRYSFLVILAGALWMAYGVIAEKVAIVVGDGYRGVYNSAWIGMLMAINCSTFLSLCGFYVVKNSVERDSQTRVGRILAATPKV